jgi:hypothetical protein
MHIGVCWEIQKEGDHYEDLDVGGRIILKWILERYDTPSYLSKIHGLD